MTEINLADTSWVLVSTALVLLMTPGLALFYGGLVQRKNVLSTFMHSFMALGIVTIQWVVVGYSLAFGSSQGGFVGGFDFAFLRGVGLEPHGELGGAVPHMLFMAFQMMFAVITPALISGAYAERIKFSTYVVFTLLWATLVYDPVCHWVWHPQGWLLERGALDFAGGTVVHMTSGISALVAAIVIGKRQRRAPPHSLTMVLTGAALLWFGWFGFNAGSALGANGIAALALTNTHIAAAVGATVWATIEWVKLGKPTALGAASGLVAGLVVITPAAGFVEPIGAIALGVIAGGGCFLGVLLKGWLGYDDALDAFGVHGVGGTLGAIAVGLFAATAANPGGQDGLLYGGSGELMLEQLIAVGVTAVYSAALTYGLLKILDVTMGLRVSDDAEREGLDTSQHGEEGYIFGGASGTLSDESYGTAHDARV